VDGGTRREPAFEPESEAYSLFRRGLGFLDDRHPAQAAMLLERALRLEPGRNSIREALGRACFALGRFERAAELFAAIVAAAPDNDYARYALGRSLVEAGRGREAVGHLRLACALRPGKRLYVEALEAASSPE
jgi:tetratricopeptide (TPR) repeat protein